MLKNIYKLHQELTENGFYDNILYHEKIFKENPIKPGDCRDRKDKIKFVKIDVEENQDLAIELGIRSVPTVIIYDGENAVDRTAGNQPLETYTKVLNTL